jgi:hypothetical protein
MAHPLPACGGEQRLQSDARIAVGAEAGSAARPATQEPFRDPPMRAASGGAGRDRRGAPSADLKRSPGRPI